MGEQQISIGVVGAGAMGRGIAQLFAQAGQRVLLHDAVAGAAANAVEAIAATLAKAVEKGRQTPAAAAALVAAIRPCAGIAELAGCGLVIEAIVEDLGAKQALFATLEGLLAPDAILASNTSSLVVAEIASKCTHPGRVAGLHFFNPVPLMKVVEVIAAVRTRAEVVETLRHRVEAAGHRAVVVADQPGFLVNHAGRGYGTEALRLLEERVAGVAEIDALLREAAGFRMGPFELLDLTGLDVSGKVMESIYAQFHQEPRFRPSSLVPPRVAAGLHGRKTGAGWYAYGADGRPLDAEPPARAVPPLPAGLRVWVEPAATQCTALLAAVGAAGARAVETAEAADLILIQPWGSDASRHCAAQRLDARRCVAVDPLPGLDRRLTLMLTAITEPAARDAAVALLARLGPPLTVIADSPGFVVQRVLATIVNIAANIAQRGIASVADIDDAVRLGLGYPHGPLAWGDRIGGERVLAILQAMHAQTGDPRYRPSPWLARRVALGVSLATAEAARG